MRLEKGLPVEVKLYFTTEEKPGHGDNYNETHLYTSVSKCRDIDRSTIQPHDARFGVTGGRTCERGCGTH